MDGDTYNIYFEGLRRVIRNPDISTSAKAVLTDLILFAGTNGDCFPNEITLAEDMGLSDRHIRRLLTELSKKQLVRWLRGKPGQSNRYTLSPEIYMLKTRTPIPAQLGHTVPVQTGHTCPTNVISESNHLKSSQAQLHFEEAFKRKCTPSEAIRLQGLCDTFSEEWVLEAIEEASKRHFPVVKVGLLGLILGDWNRDGRPEAKPVFIPCGRNGCYRGYIHNVDRNTYTICTCKSQYDVALEKWNRGNNKILI